MERMALVTVRFRVPAICTFYITTILFYGISGTIADNIAVPCRHIAVSTVLCLAARGALPVHVLWILKRCSEQIHLPVEWSSKGRSSDFYFYSHTNGSGTWATRERGITCLFYVHSTYQETCVCVCSNWRYYLPTLWQPDRQPFTILSTRHYQALFS